MTSSNTETWNAVDVLTKILVDSIVVAVEILVETAEEMM